MTNTPIIIAAVVAIAGIAAVTVALVTGHIDGATFAGLVGPLAGVGVGAGAHASGVASSSS